MGGGCGGWGVGGVRHLCDAEVPELDPGLLAGHVLVQEDVGRLDVPVQDLAAERDVGSAEEAMGRVRRCHFISLEWEGVRVLRCALGLTRARA